MTRLLLPLSLLLSLSLAGQTNLGAFMDSLNISKSATISTGYPLTISAVAAALMDHKPITVPVQDTIPVIMLVSDTVGKVTGYLGTYHDTLVNGRVVFKLKNEQPTYIYDPEVYWQYGYEVMEWPDKNGYVITGTFATFVGYLDEDKKPLTLFCWMSKEIKK